MILKKGRKKIPHFAHRPDTACEYNNSGESEEHRRAELELYQTLLVTPGVTKLQLERFLGNVRPDVSFAFNGHYVALESPAYGAARSSTFASFSAACG
ncbi:competence protein CoiA family protein [Dictyobacter formicarum]|uniref:Competence protein CoiA-like N-terminal domain-containing protein n=1 Tax=Dictyobacter formicarum TaxID=2778368 RepID=A0ABQ3VAR5_9CHLR|nr:hypothetical protein KSZ_12460 [Dictyobacter formicarum]